MNTVGGTAQIALQHPVDQRHREAVRLQQGGRGSRGAQEGFDLRPQRDLYHNNVKPKSLKGYTPSTLFAFYYFSPHAFL